MQPDFALSLSFEGIGLLRRVDDGWAQIEFVSLDSDDMDAAMTAMRQRAEALDPDGSRVSLVIPNEQIRYLDLPDLGGDTSARDTAIRAALDGATPYTVEELVYDHSLSGRRLLIAAVARETLNEAQGFAEGYGFKPVSYLARAENDAFEGAVFFGAVPSWKGARPTRPAQALALVDPTEAAFAPKLPPAPEPEPAVPETPKASDDTTEQAAPADASTDAPEDAPKVQPTPETTEQAAPAVRFASIRATREDGNGAVKAPAAPKLDAPAPQVERRFTPVVPAPNPARDAGVTAKSIETEKTPDSTETAKPSVSAPVAEKAERASAGGAAAVAAGAASAAARLLGKRASRDAKDAAPKAQKPKGRKKAAREATPPVKLMPAVPKAPEVVADTPVIAARKAEPAPAAPSQDAKGRLAALAARRTTSSQPAAAGGAAAMALDDERERMTVFGARNRDQVGGKPRFLGLMLTSALLLFLAAVAAWATVFLDDGLASLFRREEAPKAIAAAPELPPAPIEEKTETAPSLAATAPLVLPDAPTQPSGSDGSEEREDIQLAALETAPSTTDAPPALAVPIVPQELTPQEAAATYAATGIWQRAPAAPHLPPLDGVEDIYVASIDPAVQESDAVALPSVASFGREPVIADPGLPPPAGLRFDIDDRGLVRATPEGALTPEGLRIFIGPPPVIPPLRGERPVDEPEPVVQAALATIRPAQRPDDLVEQRERATLGGISRDELAALRPVMRPKTAQEVEVEAEPEATATDRAVEKSLTPVSRPRNIARIVERAEETKEDEPVQVAAVAPRTVQPSIPSSTSVAKAATVRNAINLGKINLIGVYGTASNRRALVRLPSGGYRKVKVGDRLDGGRVAAIGESELRYTKGGRNIVLKMPRS